MMAQIGPTCGVSLDRTVRRHILNWMKKTSPRSHDKDEEQLTCLKTINYRTIFHTTPSHHHSDLRNGSNFRLWSGCRCNTAFGASYGSVPGSFSLRSSSQKGTKAFERTASGSSSRFAGYQRNHVHD